MAITKLGDISPELPKALVSAPTEQKPNGFSLAWQEKDSAKKVSWRNTFLLIIVMAFVIGLAVFYGDRLRAVLDEMIHALGALVHS